MSDDARSCPACGARVPPGADACDLCGTPVDESADAADDGTDRPRDPEGGEDQWGADADAEAEAGARSAPEQVFCNECGWENPPGANYCSQCGSRLQDLTEGADAPAGTRAVSADLPTGASSAESPSTPASAEADADEQAEMGQQVLLVVGVAVVLVLGLFFLTQWSQQYEWGSTNASGGGQATTQQPAGAGNETSSAAAGPSAGGGGTPAASPAAAAQTPTDLSTLVNELGASVDGSVADNIDSLEAAVSEADGDRRRQLQAQLVNLYIGGGAPGRAAQIQTELAEQTGRVQDYRRAADLLYKWMRQVEQNASRAKVADVARHVAEAYAAVVEQRPQDLDARTRMGEAYMLTNSPMKGIRAINQVLEDDSTFVPARFQKGLALLQINRLDQAVAQFERVMAHASQDNPFYRQAKRAIEVIRKETSSSSGGRASSGS